LKKLANGKDPLKFGLTEMTLKEVSKAMGLSRVGVSDIEARALKKARKLIEARMKKQDILPD
jgi:DNA-directed RNA polymerase sigma subunit (sigma70/sigma32)